MSQSLDQRLQHQLTALKAEGRYRSLRAPAGLDFSSNDYLGLGKCSRPESGAAPGLARTGAASRLLRGHHALWDEVENTLAAWHQTEAALIFTSGYVANEGLLSTVVGAEDVVFSDQANHASIIDGLRLSRARRVVFRHNDLDHLEECLRNGGKQRGPGQQFFIVTESLFGMDGDRAPLVAIMDLAERHAAHLIVDEAHATGCFGRCGAGLVDELGLRPRVLATVHTGGKAIGVPGAYVACAGLLRDYLINRCRHFIFTTALPPRIAAWWLDAVERVQAAADLRVRLHENARRFRAALAERGLRCPGADFIVPVPIGPDTEAVAAAQRLQDQGYDIRAIRPPTVAPGTSRLRVSIHADHEPATLRALATILVDSDSMPA